MCVCACVCVCVCVGISFCLDFVTGEDGVHVPCGGYMYMYVTGMTTNTSERSMQRRPECYLI